MAESTSGNEQGQQSPQSYQPSQQQLESLLPLQTACALRLLYAHQPLASDVLSKLQALMRNSRVMASSANDLVRSLNDYSSGLSDFDEDPAAQQARKTAEKLSDLLSRTSCSLSSSVLGEVLRELEEGCVQPYQQYLSNGDVVRTKENVLRVERLQNQLDALKKRYKETAAGRKVTPAKIKEILEEQELVRQAMVEVQKDLGLMADDCAAEIAETNAKLFVSVAKAMQSGVSSAATVIADFTPYCDSFDLSSATPNSVSPLPSPKRPTEQQQQQSTQEAQQVQYQMGKIIELFKSHLELLKRIREINDKMTSEQTALKLTTLTVTAIFQGVPEAIDVTKQVLGALLSSNFSSTASSVSKSLADCLQPTVNRMTEIAICLIKGMMKMVQEMDLNNVAMSSSSFSSQQHHHSRHQSMAVSSKRLDAFDKKYELRFHLASASRHLHQLKALTQSVFDHTNPASDRDGWESLHECLDSLTSGMDRIDDARIECEQALQLVSLKKLKLVDLELEPVRPFLYDSDVTLPMTPTIKHRLFLFSDCLILGQEIIDDHSDDSHFKTVLKVRLVDTCLSSGLSRFGDTNGFRLEFSAGIEPKFIVCICANEPLHSTWTKLLDSAITQRKKTQVFNVSLEQQMEHVSMGHSVPSFLERLAEVIEYSAMSLGTEGLYRLSASVTEITRLKARLDEGKMQFINEWMDPMTATALFKLWLRELTAPLIDCQHYSEWMACDLTVASLQCLVRQQHTVHYNTLKWVCLHLNKVSRCSDQTKMDARNLAVVMQPAFFSRPAGVSEQRYLLDVPVLGKITCELIDKAHQIFCDAEEVKEPAAEESGEVKETTKKEKRKTLLFNRSVAAAAAAAVTPGGGGFHKGEHQHHSRTVSSTRLLSTHRSGSSSTNETLSCQVSITAATPPPPSSSTSPTTASVSSPPPPPPTVPMLNIGMINATTTKKKNKVVTPRSLLDIPLDDPLPLNQQPESNEQENNSSNDDDELLEMPLSARAGTTTTTLTATTTTSVEALRTPRKGIIPIAPNSLTTTGTPPPLLQ